MKLMSVRQDRIDAKKVKYFLLIHPANIKKALMPEIYLL